jgi:prophage regulatory protein
LKEIAQTGGVKVNMENKSTTLSLELIRERELLSNLNVHHSTIWRWVKNNGFPRPIRIGVRATAWRRRDIESWLNARDGAR